jgi:hypothetical protein
VFLVELFTVLFAEIEIELEIVLKLLFQNKTTVEEVVKKAFACNRMDFKLLVIKSFESFDSFIFCQT